MSKIMLVEDDNNLREIYEARLLAEGYEIVSAHDGEEALALAIKEKPDLIISDVMMPKISGFDMLDILRSTPETKDTKVIMMTALSQAEDKDRAEKLGADRYLVKSQVTLEDVAKIAREVLEGPGAAGAAPTPPPAANPALAADPTTATPAPVAAPVATEPPTTAATNPVADPAPVTPVPDPSPVAPAVTDTPIPETSTLGSIEDAQTASDEQSTVDTQVNQFVGQNPGSVVTPGSPATAASPTPTNDSSISINGKKTLNPIGDPTAKPDLNKLLQDEQNKTEQASATAASGDDPNLISL